MPLPYSTYIKELDDLTLGFSTSAENKHHPEKTSHHIINKCFEVLHSCIEDRLILKKEYLVLTSARERIGFNRGFMKGIHLKCESNALRKHFRDKIAEPLEINSTYFKNEFPKGMKHDSHSYIKPFRVKGVNKYKIETPKGRKSRDPSYSALTGKNTFKARLENFLSIVSPSEVPIQSILVYGRNFSDIRRENSFGEKDYNYDDNVDQIVAIYFNCNILETGQEEIKEFKGFLDELFKRIDLIKTLSLLALERALRKIIAERLPLAIKQNESPAKTIKKTNASLAEELMLYLSEVHGAVNTPPGSQPVKSNFVHLGYKHRINESEPDFRPFPESCGLNSHEGLPLRNQLVLRSTRLASLTKYFINLYYEAKKAPDHTEKPDCTLSDNFNLLFKEISVDKKIKDDRLASITKQIDDSHPYIKYTDTSHCSTKLKGKIPWQFNKSVFEGDNKEGSTLIYGLKLSDSDINTEIEKPQFDLNALLVFESTDPFLFGDELSSCIDKIMPLYVSMLKIIPLAKNFIDYEKPLREKYFKKSLEGANGWDITREYDFKSLAFDLFRTDIHTIEKSFLDYYILLNETATKKEVDQAGSYISDIVESIKLDKKDSPIFDKKRYLNFREDYLTLSQQKYPCPNLKNQLKVNYGKLQREKRDHIIRMSEHENAIPELIDKILSNEQLVKTFVGFMQITNSCVIWSSWLGAIRTVLKTRFDNGAEESELQVRLIDSGYSALELLVVNTVSEKIKQVIKLGNKDKLEKEKLAYNKFVRYQLTDAARIPSSTDGFTYLCDGEGIFEYGTLLSDLVGFTNQGLSQESTLKSLLTPIKEEHPKQIPYQKGSDVIERILFTLFNLNLDEAWVNKNPSQEQQTQSASELIKYCFRLTDFEKKTKLKFQTTQSAPWPNLIMLKQEPPYKVKAFQASLTEMFDNFTNQIAPTSKTPSSFLNQQINNIDRLDQTFKDQGLPCRLATIHGDLTFYNILMTGTSTPDRPVLIDFEHVKEGFYGADLIHLLFNGVTNHISLRDFLNVPTNFSRTLDHNNPSQVRFKSQTVFYTHIFHTIEFIDNFDGALNRVASHNPANVNVNVNKVHGKGFNLRKNNTTAPLPEEDAIKVENNAKEFLISIGLASCVEEAVQSKIGNTRNALINIATAYQNIPRRMTLYSSLLDRIFEEIKGGKSLLDISDEKTCTKNSLMFWLNSMLCAALVQLIYSLLNVLTLNERVFGNKDGKIKFNAQAKILSKFDFEEFIKHVNSATSDNCPDYGPCNELLESLHISDNNKLDIFAGWFSVILAMRLLSVIVIRNNAVSIS